MLLIAFVSRSRPTMLRSHHTVALLGVALGLAVAGCHRREYEPPMASVRGMRFYGSSSFRNGNTDSLLVEVSSENRSGERRTLMSGSCGRRYESLIVRIISVARPKSQWSTTAWQNAERARRAANRVVLPNGVVLDEVCAGVGIDIDVAPGDGIKPVAAVIVPVRDILGDSLPPGRYRIEALVTGSASKAGYIRAGEVDLRGPSR
jgi:hypothetical protein